MKRSTLFCSLVILALVAGAGCAAGNPLSVAGARANVCQAGDDCGVFLTIANSAGAADILVGASSDVAGMSSLHTVVSKADGTTEMVPVENVPIPAAGSVELKPGSFHVMLMGLNRDLKEGDTFALNLKFGRAKDLTVQVNVHAVS